MGKEKNKGEFETREVEGGGFQASMVGGEPNQFGEGDSPEEAIAQLKRSMTTPVTEVRTNVEAVQNIEGKEDKVITRLLQKPVEIEQEGVKRMVKFVAYRQSSPERQAYGADENSARVQLLTLESKPK